MNLADFLDNWKKPPKIDVFYFLNKWDASCGESFNFEYHFWKQYGYCLKDNNQKDFYFTGHIFHKKYKNNKQYYIIQHTETDVEFKIFSFKKFYQTFLNIDKEFNNNAFGGGKIFR